MAKSKTAQAVTAPEPSKPSLAEEIAKIEARLKQQAVDEKRQLALGYLKDARARMKGLLAKTTDQALKAAVEEVRQLEKMVGDDGASEDGGGKRRVRRSADDLKADAEKLVAYLRANPGSKGSAVQEATGVEVKPPLNIRTFVEKHLPGVKIKVEGQKAGTTYSLGK